MKVFVVHHTIFDYKPGHMYLSCDGVYLNWNDALKKALSLMDDVDGCEDDGDDGDGDGKTNLPTTEAELRNLLPERGCVWEFGNGKCAEWWDGDECGSKLISISFEDVREDANEEKEATSENEEE